MIGLHKKTFEFKTMIGLNLQSIEDEAKLDALNTAVAGSEQTPNTLNQHIKEIDLHLKEEVNRAQAKLHELQELSDNSLAGIKKENIEINVSINVKEKIHLRPDQTTLEIDNLNASYEQRNNDFNRFRTFYNRPFLPTRATKSTFIIFGILSLLFIIEASMNAFFFKEIGGLLLAYTLSISQAFINVVSCFFFGCKIWTKMLYSSTTNKKIFFGFLVALHAFTIIWLNLAMGLYRALDSGDMFAADHTEKLRWALTPFSHLELFNMDSALVSGVGLILAFLAYLDGYFSDDPYPGYGKSYRQVLDTRKKLTEYISKIDDNTKEAEIDFDKTILNFHEKGINSISTWSKSINEMEKIEVDYKAFVKSLNDRLKLIYNNYNRNFRSNNFSPILYDKSDMDPMIVFKDAKEYFLNDNDRRKLKTEYENNFNKYFDEIRNKEEKLFNNDLNNLRNKITTYPQNLVGEAN